MGYNQACIEVYGRLSSFLIGDMTQQGKSVIAAFLACYYTALAGTHIILIDPHCNNKKRGLLPKIEPLREWFALPPVDFSAVDEVISRFEWLEQEYQRRKQDMKNAQPILLLIDEFNEFLTGCGLSKRQKTYVTQVIANCARGGSKHGLFTGNILHNADVSKSGGSEETPTAQPISTPDPEQEVEQVAPKQSARLHIVETNTDEKPLERVRQVLSEKPDCSDRELGKLSGMSAATAKKYRLLIEQQCSQVVNQR